MIEVTTENLMRFTAKQRFIVKKPKKIEFWKAMEKNCGLLSIITTEELK